MLTRTSDRWREGTHRIGEMFGPATPFTTITVLAFLTVARLILYLRDRLIRLWSD